MKKYLTIICLTIMLLAIAGSIQAAKGDYPTIVQDYPMLKACKDASGNDIKCRPGQEGFGFAEFIKYIYLFAIGMVGAVGFVAIIFAAFGYTTSAGNPQKAAHAKEQMLSALLGIVLLLGSVVVLNFINPDMLKLKMSAESVYISTDIDECKKECAATGPPSPACLQECEAPKTGCRPISVQWEKPEINVGDSVYLIYKLNKNCKDNAEIAFCGNNEGSFLRQVRPAEAGTCPTKASFGWDPYCAKYYFTGNWQKSYDKDGSILLKYLYAFNKQCRDKWGTTECPVVICPGTTGTICNFMENRPETFYAEGKCKMNTGETFYPAQKVFITVNDNK